MSTGNEYNYISLPKKYPIVTISANTTLNLTSHPNSLLAVNQAGNTFLIMLPDVNKAKGLKYRLYVATTGASDVTIQANGTDTIAGCLIGGNGIVAGDGNGVYMEGGVITLGSWIELTSDGTQWQHLAVSSAVNGFTIF